MALVSSLGCKQEEPTVEAKDYPARMADGYCGAVYSCQCDDYPYESYNECFADRLENYDLANDAAFLAGLAYDGTCPAQELETIQSLQCQGALPAVPNICAPPCNVWHGQLQAGYPCQVLESEGAAALGLSWSNCAQGLTCSGGICINPCQGGMALPAIGQPCPDNVCAAGAMCDETMTCVAATPLPGAGQPCLAGVCNATSVCVAAANTCAALPAIGQPCIEGQCNAQATCNADSLCIAKPPLACFLLGGGIPGDGDGDGDPTTGDGDGDTTGDGDGDTTGDGDGDTTGDGDGDTGCSPIFIGESVPNGYSGNTLDAEAVYTGSCGGAGPEAILSFIAPGAGVYGIDTDGSDFDTILYVRDGGDCSGAELACDDDTLAPASALSVPLTAGQEITIIVDSYSGGGNFTLNIGLL